MTAARRRAGLVLPALLFVPGAGLSAPLDKLALGAPRLQLYYGRTGQLSRNIAPPVKVDLWNTGAGDGDAGGAASDALVSVPLVARVQDAPNTPTGPVTLSVRNAKGKVLASHVFAPGYVFVPQGEQVLLPLWVHDIACAGNITIVASYRAQTTRATMNFDCGE